MNQVGNSEVVGGEGVGRWLFTVQEVSEMLDVSVSTLVRAIRRGDLKVFRRGRVVRLTRDSVNAFVERWSQ